MRQKVTKLKKDHLSKDGTPVYSMLDGSEASNKFKEWLKSLGFDATDNDFLSVEVTNFRLKGSDGVTTLFTANTLRDPFANI